MGSIADEIEEEYANRERCARNKHRREALSQQLAEFQDFRQWKPGRPRKWYMGDIKRIDRLYDEIITILKAELYDLGGKL